MAHNRILKEQQDTSVLQTHNNNKSYLQNSKIDDMYVSYQDLTPARRNFDDSFGGIDDEFSHKQQKSNFKMKDHEDLARVNKRKDSEMMSVDHISSRSGRPFNEDRSPRMNNKISAQIEEQLRQLQAGNNGSAQKQKKKDIANIDEDEEKLFNKQLTNPIYVNKTTQDLTNQPSYNVVLDGISYVKQSSSNQKGMEFMKNEGESTNNLKITSSFRKNLNSDISLNDKSPVNFDSYQFDGKQAKGNHNILMPPKLNESYCGSAGQDTFRPVGTSLQYSNYNQTQSKKGFLQEQQRTGTKKDLNALLSNSRKIKLISKIRQKFSSFLQNHTLSGRTKVLDSNIRNMISDEVDYGYNKTKKKQKIHSLFIIILEFFIEKLIYFTRIDKLPLFDPENPIKIIFNTIIVAYNCFFLYWMSIEVFFDAHVGDIGHYLGYTAQVCWITEMLVQMNTCLYHDNEYITDRKEIMVIYFEEYLFFEVLPLIFEGRKSSNITINILLHLPLLLKFKGMSIILKKLEFYVLQILKNHYFLQLFKLIILLFFLAHIEACLYNVVGQIELNILNRNVNWINDNPIHDGNWWNAYLTSLFWAFSIMMNTSTKPTTEIEIIFTCFCMLFSCVFFGYTLNMIGNILIDIERQQKEYKKDLNILNQFMKRKNVSLSYRRKANISLQDFYAHNREKIKQEEEVISKINPNLVKEILIAANKNILQKSSLLSEQFSQDVLDKIYTHLEEETFAPRQIILNQSSCEDEQKCIYFVASGKVEIFSKTEKKEIQFKQKRVSKRKTFDELHSRNKLNPLRTLADLHHNEQTFSENKDDYEIITKKCKKIINTLTPGDSFGQFGFFTGMENDYLAQSANFTTVMKLRRSKFIEILQEHPQEYEKFCEIKDKILNEKEENLFFCYLCESNDHSTLECNKVFFDKNNFIFYFKNNYSTPQQRAKEFMYQNKITTRKRKRYTNTILKIQLIQDSVSKIYQDDALTSLLNQYYDELEQLSYSESDLEEEEGNQTDSLSFDKSLEQFEIDNDNFSQFTHKSAKSNHNRKSILNNQKEEFFMEDKAESLNYKQTPVIAPNINMIYASNNNFFLPCDTIDSPVGKKRHLSAMIYEERYNSQELEQKNSIDFQQNPLTRSIISNNNNIRKLSAAKKSTFLSEQISFNTKEFDDHFNKAQDILVNQQYSIQNDQQKELHEVLNQTCNKLKVITEKYKSLFSHYVTAKRQLKSIKTDSPKSKIMNGGQKQFTPKDTLMLDAESQMLVSADKYQAQTPSIPANKSKFLEETFAQPISQPYSQVNAINTNKESYHDIDVVSKRYPHKETVIMNTLAQIQNFIWTFDIYRNFTKYFPDFNYEKVIRKANNQIQKNQKKKNIKKKEISNSYNNNLRLKQLVSMKSDGKQNSSLQQSKQLKQSDNFEAKKSKNDQQHSSIFHLKKQKEILNSKEQK